MRNILLLNALLCLFHTQVQAQNMPYSTSTVRGSTIITNYYDPNAGPSVPPGLSNSPLESRFTSPLGTPWGGQQSVGPSVTATYSSTPSSASTLAPSSSVTSLSGDRYEERGGTAYPTVGNYSTPSGSSYPSQYSGGYLQANRNQPLVPMQLDRANNAYPGIPEEPTYFYPGLVRHSQNHWVGSEYLYNMPQNIGIVVEVVQSGNAATSRVANVARERSKINADLLRDNVSEIFRTAGIYPVSESVGDRPPLPFFHLLVFFTPVEDSYVFSMTGRLFEEVSVARLHFKTPGVFQAITWEKQELVVTSEKLLEEQLLTTAREIAGLFMQRVDYYKRLVAEQEELLRLRCGSYPTIKCAPRHRSRF